MSSVACSALTLVRFFRFFVFADFCAALDAYAGYAVFQAVEEKRDIDLSQFVKAMRESHKSNKPIEEDKLKEKVLRIETKKK